MNLIDRQYDKDIWSLKYRPRNLSEMCLPDYIMRQSKNILQTGRIPNMLFNGSAGIGKTSLAFLISKELDCSTHYINFSKDRGIDVVRMQVERFAMSSIINGKKKVLIGDEFDRATKEAQDSLKVLIETYSKTTSFIFITNEMKGISDPILSRLQTVNFIFPYDKIGSKKYKQIIGKRIKYILKSENIQCADKHIITLIKRYYPDIRKVITELQGIYQTYGHLNDSININTNVINNDIIKNYFLLVKEKNVLAVREWIENTPLDVNAFYRTVNKVLPNYIDLETSPEAILYLADRAKESETALNKEINIAAFTIELMGCIFK